MLPRILLTGFKSFIDVDFNPTELLMDLVFETRHQIPDTMLRTLVMETDYELCEQQFHAAITDFAPDIVLSFGVSYATEELKLEQNAINLDDSFLPDNSGEQRRGQAIVEGGPPVHQATIPIELVYEVLKHEGIPVRISDHASTFVCNHLLYYGLHLIGQYDLDTLMGFMHVPPLVEQRQRAGHSKLGIDLDTLLYATRLSVITLTDYVRKVRPTSH